MKVTIFRIVAVLTVLSMLLTACGGAATPAPAPAQATAVPQPTTAPEPTKAPAPTAAPAPTEAPVAAAGGVIEAKPGQSLDMILLPKFMGNAVFDEANARAPRKPRRNSRTPANSATSARPLTTASPARSRS